MPRRRGLEYDNYDNEGGDLNDETADLINNRVNTNSRKVYLSQINRLTDWIILNKPEFYDRDLRRLILPLDNPTILSYATALSRNEDGSSKSNSSLCTFRSALKDMYCSRNVDFQSHNNQITMLLKGHKRKVATLKENGEMKQEEGKRPLTYQGFRMLAGRAMRAGMTLCHLYLLSQWNLMVRTVSVSNLNYTFFNWEEDSLTIKCPRSKGDQDGTYAFPKHCYANPHDPSVCFFTALGKLYF
jgi:hypothetical protein